MEKGNLKLRRHVDGTYQTLFKTRHGRKVYCKLQLMGEAVRIETCFYVDRPMQSGKYSVPQKWNAVSFPQTELLRMMERMLDGKFYDVTTENTYLCSTEDYIKEMLGVKTKYKFLILVRQGNVLKTRLKNRAHRGIYLEIQALTDGRGTIYACYYDRKYKRNGALITPQGLHTVFFEYSRENILKIVNEELNCDFTDVLITENIPDFAETDLPLCGAI